MHARAQYKRELINTRFERTRDDVMYAPAAATGKRSDNTQTLVDEYDASLGGRNRTGPHMYAHVYRVFHKGLHNVIIFCVNIDSQIVHFKRLVVLKTFFYISKIKKSFNFIIYVIIGIY